MTLGSGSYVITGAASGIGRECARALAESGGRPILVDLDATALRETAEALKLDADVGEPAWRAVDVSRGDQVAALASWLGGVGPISGVVNAAGVVQLGSISDVTEDDWDRVLGVNLKGVFLVCRALLPLLVRDGGGSIVNIASVSGRTKSIYSAPNYVASKAGVIGLTMALAAQLARDNVRVNSVAPGLVDTAMLSAYTDEQQSIMRAAVPMGRFADAREIASTVLFLLSDESSYVTGQTLNVNGGQFMQ